MTRQTDLLDAAEEQDLVRLLARDVVALVVPEEKDVYAANEALYLSGRGPNAGRESQLAIGGLELALVPAIVEAVKFSVRYLGGVLAEAADDETRDLVHRWIRRLLRHDADDEPAPPALPQELLRTVREQTYRVCMARGEREDDAVTIAYAVVGRLALSGGSPP